MRQRGLTLVELIVTLVIASMVLGLLTQMLDQGRQLEARMQRVGETATAAPWRLSLLREALRGMLPAQAQEPAAFRGDALAFSGASLTVPDAQGSSAKSLRVSLRRESDGQSLRIDTAPDGKDWEIARWPSRDGRFVYLDRHGARHEQWPPRRASEAGEANDAFLALPSAVLVLQGGAPGAPVHVLPLVASPLQPTTLRQLEGL